MCVVIVFEGGGGQAKNVYTLNPSLLKHSLCASMAALHASLSPVSSMHASRSLRVSGHEQQIFFPLLPSCGPSFLPPVAAAVVAVVAAGTAAGTVAGTVAGFAA